MELGRIKPHLVRGLCFFPGCAGLGQHPCSGKGGRGQHIGKCRTNIPTVTFVLPAWHGLCPYSGLWAGDPRVVGGVKALQGRLSRTL